MIDALRTKSVAVFGPATAASSATASARVDVLGFRYATIKVQTPAATATNSSHKLGALKLTESDTTTYAGSDAIVAFTGTTNTVTDATNGFVIAAHNDTSQGQVTRLMVNCARRKRYLFVTYQGYDTATNTTAVNALLFIGADLDRAEEMPGSASDSTLGPGAIAIG